MGSQYEKFGNFNYGATGRAWGFPDWHLFMMAGQNQIKKGNSKPEWQPGGGGQPPYGDDPEDQKWTYWIDDHTLQLEVPWQAQIFRKIDKWEDVSISVQSL